MKVFRIWLIAVSFFALSSIAQYVVDIPHFKTEKALAQTGVTFFPGPGLNVATPPIGPCAYLGGNSGTNVASSTGVTITTGANIVSGDLVVVGITIGINAVTVGSVVDSGGSNTYTVFTNGTSGGTITDIEMWSVPNAAAVSSATITAKPTGTANGFNVVALRCPNLQASPLDLHNNNFSTSISTGALSQAKELIVAIAAASVAGTGWTASGSFTSGGSTVDGNHDANTFLQYQIVNSTSSVTSNPTPPSGSIGANAFGTFKGM